MPDPDHQTFVISYLTMVNYCIHKLTDQFNLT